MLVLILVCVHRCAESDEVVRGLLVLEAEVPSTVDFGGESRVALISQRPIDDHGMVLVWLKEPFLMRGQWGPILLVGASVKGARINVAIEAHTCFKERVRALDAVANEGGQLLATLPVWNSEEVARSVGEFLKPALEVTLPARARVDAGLWLPVFFVLVKILGPVGGRRAGREGRKRGRRG
jgi:hypothetical protein